MKHPFLKSVLVLGSVLAFTNCSEEAADILNNANNSALQPSDNGSGNNGNGDSYNVTEACWLFVADQPYFINTSYVVTNLNGDIVGIYDPASLSITALDGVTPIFTGVDTSKLEVLVPSETSVDLPPVELSSAVEIPTYSSEALIITSSATIDIPVSSEQQLTVESSSSEQVATSSSSQPKSSSATSDKQCNGQCYDSASGKCVGYHDQQTGSKGEKYAYDESCKLNCYYDPNNQSCQNMTGSTPASSSSVKSSSSAKSSSSMAKSSSSVKSSSSMAKSSSSVKSSSSSAKSSSSTISSSSTQIITSGCPAIKTKGGSSGSGFASRYWDGCKPSCSWKNNAGSAGPAKQCSANGKTENTNYDEQSVCSGGGAATCTSQIPFTVDGCDNIGFAFAAVPASNGGQCGKCFQLSFTGKGKYETKQNHKALAGKKLIVMVTNIGADVNQGQFDVMIPGGGVGIYNGTSGYGWGSQGAQYGGLLTECENEIGYNASNLLEKRKSCLVEKCNKSFSSDATAKQGCLFLANFMEAAGNPMHEYVEVECPDVLKNKY